MSESNRNLGPGGTTILHIRNTSYVIVFKVIWRFIWCTYLETAYNSKTAGHRAKRIDIRTHGY